VELERSFNGQLCQEYSCQNGQNVVILVQVIVADVGDPFLRHCVYMYRVSQNKIPQHENHDICVVSEYFRTEFFSFIQHRIIRKAV